MFLKALGLYFLEIVFLSCDNAIVADCHAIAADYPVGDRVYPSQTNEAMSYSSNDIGGLDSE